VWNIVFAKWEEKTLTIKGVNSDPADNHVLFTTIQITDLFTVVKEQQKDGFNYDESISITVINPNLVYKIDLEIDEDIETAKWLKEQKYVSADTEDLKFFGAPFMGLPLLVFMHWKGLINTDIS